MLRLNYFIFVLYSIIFFSFLGGDIIFLKKLSRKILTLKLYIVHIVIMQLTYPITICEKL